GTLDAVGELERRKPRVRRLAERAGLEEAAGLEKAQAVLIARRDQQRAIELVRPPRDLVARRRVGAMVAEEGEEVARDLGARAGAAEPQRGARPIGVALREQRQVEQPFARVVDDLEPQRRGAAADLVEEKAERAGRHVVDLDLDLAEVAGARRPVGGGR